MARGASSRPVPVPTASPELCPAVQKATGARTAARGQRPATSHADGVPSPPAWCSPPTLSEHRTIRQELCQQRWERGISGWPCWLMISSIVARRRSRYVVLTVDISSLRRRRCGLMQSARRRPWAPRGAQETHEQRPWTGSRGGGDGRWHECCKEGGRARLESPFPVASRALTSMADRGKVAGQRVTTACQAPGHDVTRG